MGRKRSCPPVVGGLEKFCEQETLRLLPFIEGIAIRSGLRFPIEDLVQEGAMACYQHLPRFEPERGLKIETFLQPRIWGAMQDYARAHGRWLKGGKRNRPPEDVLSLSLEVKKAGSADRPTPLADLIVDEATAAPEFRALRQSVWKTVLRGLAQRERLLVLEYFVHGRTLKQIGEDLGLSESRCSQMLTKILAWMRSSNEIDGQVRAGLEEIVARAA